MNETATNSELRTHRVQALLHPKSIAIVGASPKPGGWTRPIATNLERFGFGGEIWGINPNYGECLGFKCFPDVASLPATPDQLVFLVPPDRVVPVLEDAARRGTRSAVIVSGGFGPEAKDGPRLAAELAAALERTGIAACGPNCMGNVTIADNLVTLADTRFVRLESGPVAVVSQSGGILTALCRALIDRDTGFTYLISSGNQLGLDVADYLAYLAESDETKVIALFIEGIPRPRAFLDACRLCTEKGKAIVALKVGGSEAAREGAATHTGVLAGALSVFRGAVAGFDVTVADNLDQMIELIELYRIASRPKRRNPGVAAVTFSGGMRNLILDGAERQSVPFPDFSPATRAVLETHIPARYVANPLDSFVASVLPREIYRDCIAAILDDPAIDLLLVQEELPRAPGQPDKEETLINLSRLAVEKGKPIAAVSMLSHAVTDHGRLIRRSADGIAFLQEIDKSLLAIERWRKRDPSGWASAPLPTSPDAARAARWRQYLQQADGALDEHQSKTLLADWGLAAPREEACRTREDALAAADRIGYPVALKILSPDITHKTEVGGVALGIGSPDQLRTEYEHMMASVGARARDARIDGVLVAEMITGGLELAVGLHRDAEFGLAIMLSAGGTLIEFLADAEFALPPLDAPAADRLLGRLRAARLLDGMRGTVLDRDALCAALLAISRLAEQIGPAIETMDINPLLVLPKGRGIQILDAVIVPRRRDERME